MFASRISQKLKGNSKLTSSVDSSDICRLVANAALRAVPSLVHPSSVFALIVSYYSTGEQRPENIDQRDFISITRAQLFHDLSTVLLSDEDADTLALAFSSPVRANNVDAALFAATSAFSSDKDLVKSVAVIRRSLSSLVYSFDIHGEPQVDTAAALKISKILSDMNEEGESSVEMLSVKDLKSSITSLGINAVVGHDEGVDSPNLDENVLDVRALHRHLRGSGSTKSAAKITGAGGGVVTRRPSPTLTDLSVFLLDIIKDFLDPALAYSQSSGNLLQSNMSQSKSGGSGENGKSNNLASSTSLSSTYSSNVGPLSAFSTNYNRSNAASSLSSLSSSTALVSGYDYMGFKAGQHALLASTSGNASSNKRVTRFEENNNTYNGLPQSVSEPEKSKATASKLLSPKPLPLSPSSTTPSMSTSTVAKSTVGEVLQTAGSSVDTTKAKEVDRINDENDNVHQHYDANSSYSSLPATNLIVSRKDLVQQSSVVEIGSIESVVVLPSQAKEADIQVYEDDGYEETDDLSFGANVWVRRLRDIDIEEARKSSKANPPSIGVVTEVTVTIAKSSQLSQQSPSQSALCPSSASSNVLAPAPLLDRFPSQRLLILEHKAPKVPASSTNGRWIAAGTWPVKQPAIGGIRRTACLWYLESEEPIPLVTKTTAATSSLSPKSSQDSSAKSESNINSTEVSNVVTTSATSTTSAKNDDDKKLENDTDKRRSHRSRHRHSSRSGSRRRHSRHRSRRRDDYDSDSSYSDSEDDDYCQSEDEGRSNDTRSNYSRSRRSRDYRNSSSDSSFTSGDSDDSRSKRYHGHGRRSSGRRRHRHHRSGRSHRHRNDKHTEEKNGKEITPTTAEGDVVKSPDAAVSAAEDASKQTTEGGVSKTEEKPATQEVTQSSGNKGDIKVDVTATAAAVTIPSELFGMIVVDVIKVAELDSLIHTGGSPLVARSWVEYASSSAKDASRSKADYDVGPNPMTAPAELGQRNGEVVWKSSTKNATSTSSSSTSSTAITKPADEKSIVNNEKPLPSSSGKDEGLFRGLKCKGDVITPIVRLVKSSGVTVADVPSKDAATPTIPAIFTQYAKKGVLIVALVKESKSNENTTTSSTSEEIGRIEVPVMDVINGVLKEPSYFDIRALSSAQLEGKKGKFVGSLYFSARWSPLTESETSLEKSKHAVFLMKQHIDAKKRRTGGDASVAAAGEAHNDGTAPQVASIVTSSRYLGDSGVDPNQVYWAQADSQLVEHEPIIASSVPLLPAQISADVPMLTSVPSSALSTRQCAMLDKLRTDYKDAFSSSLTVASKSLLPIAAACSSLDILGTGTLPASYLPKAFKLSGLLIDAGTCDRLLRLLLELSGAHPLILSKSSSFGSVLALSSISPSLSSAVSAAAPGSPAGKRGGGGGLNSPPMSPSATAARKGPMPTTYQPIAASLADHGECVFFDHILLSDLMTIPNVAVMKTDALRLASPTQQKNAAISATFTSLAATSAILRSQIRHRLRLYVATARTISKTSNSAQQVKLRFPPIKTLSAAAVSLSDAFACLLRQARILADSLKETSGGGRGSLLSSEFVRDDANDVSVLPLSLESFGDALEDLGCVIRNSDLALLASYHNAFLSGVSSRVRDDGESAFVDALAFTNDFSVPVGGEGASVTIDAKSSTTMCAPIKNSFASEADIFSSLPFSSGEKVLRSTMRSCAYLLSHLDIESPFRAASTISIVGKSKAGKRWAADDRLIPLTAGAMRKVLDETLVVSVDEETFARVVRRIRLGPAPQVTDESKKSLAKSTAASSVSESSINDVPVCAKKFLAAYCDFSEGEFADLVLRLRAYAEAERRAEKASASLLSGTSSKATFTSIVNNAFHLCAGLASEALALSTSSSSSSSVNTTSILNSTLSRRESRTTNTLLVVPGAPLGTLPSRLFARALAEANLPVSPLEAVLLARRYAASPTSSPYERNFPFSSEGLDVSIRLGIVPGGFSVHYEPVMRLITTPGSTFSQSSMVAPSSSSSNPSTAPQAGSSLDPNTVSFLMSFASEGQRVVISDVVRASLNASFSSSQDVFGGGNIQSSNEPPIIRVKQRSGSVSGSFLALEGDSSTKQFLTQENVPTSSAITSTPARGPIPPMSALPPSDQPLHQSSKSDALSFPFSAPSGEWGSDRRRNGGIEARPPRPPTLKSSSSAAPSVSATPTATPSRRARIRDDREDRKDVEEEDDDDERIPTKEEIASNAAAEKRLRDSLSALNNAAENGEQNVFTGSSMLTTSGNDMNARALEYTNTGRWSCTVCFFSSNKPYSRVCSMCDSDNPFAAPGGFQNARDETTLRTKKDASSGAKSIVVAWVCPACAFDSPAGTLECLVCSLPLQPPIESANAAMPTSVRSNVNTAVSKNDNTILQITDGIDYNREDASSKKPVISIVSPVAAGGGILLPSPTPTSNRPLTSGGLAESFHALNSSQLSTGSVAINASTLSLQAKAAFLSDPWTSRRQRPSMVTVAHEAPSGNENFVSILNASMYTTTKDIAETANESFPVVSTPKSEAPAATAAASSPSSINPVVLASSSSLPPRPVSSSSSSSTPAPQTPTSSSKKEVNLSDVDKKLIELEQRSAKSSSGSASGRSSRERLSDAKTELARSRMR